MSKVTLLLDAAAAGDPKAATELLPQVYDELRRLAASRMSAERPDHTLNPTALVHEAFLRLVGGDRPAEWDGRGHFFAAAPEAMRRILVESARRRVAAECGGDPPALVGLSTASPSHQYTSSCVAASPSRRQTSVSGMSPAPSATSRAIAAVFPLAEW